MWRPQRRRSLVSCLHQARMMGRVGGVLGLGSLAQQSAGLSSWLPPPCGGSPPTVPRVADEAHADGGGAAAGEARVDGDGAAADEVHADGGGVVADEAHADGVDAGADEAHAAGVDAVADEAYVDGGDAAARVEGVRPLALGPRCWRRGGLPFRSDLGGLVFQLSSVDRGPGREVLEVVHVAVVDAFHGLPAGREVVLGEVVW